MTNAQMYTMWALGIATIAFMVFVYRGEQEFKSKCEEKGGVVVTYRGPNTCVKPEHIIQIN